MFFFEDSVEEEGLLKAVKTDVKKKPARVKRVGTAVGATGNEGWIKKRRKN